MAILRPCLSSKFVIDYYEKPIIHIRIWLVVLDCGITRCRHLLEIFSKSLVVLAILMLIVVMLSAIRVCTHLGRQSLYRS